VRVISLVFLIHWFFQDYYRGCTSVVGTNRYDMEASVTSPSGVTEICDIQDMGTSQYSIKFIPKEMGIHTVSVKHRGMHIPGSWLMSVAH